MNIGKPRLFSAVLFTVCIGILLSSCNNENTFTIGEDFIESATNMAIIDTFTVEMSTVVQDSVPTSGFGAMLIGIFQDTLFGDVKCSSFFRLGMPEYILLDEQDIYDSLCLIIHFSGYSYGDTNSLMKINVHRLTEDIKENSDGYLYNSSSFAYDVDMLGDIQFRAYPDKSDSLEIKINNDFGLELFNKFVAKETEVQHETNFIEYFKGIALLPDESSDKVILGFNVAANTLKLRLYTHRIEQTDVKTEYDFPLVYSELQFNHIAYDFSGTPFDYTQEEETTIPSSVTGNRTFVQGFKKIMTKMQFPSLADIMLNARGIIMKAELVFEPVKGSYKDFELPDFVILYETNRRNQPVSLLYYADGSVLQAKLRVDEQYHEGTSYTFDITDFITEEMADGYFDVEHGLLISLYDETYRLNFERIVIATKMPAPKLRIYYMTY